MKKSFLVLGAIMFALLFAGCKGAEEESGSGNALQDALLELCETDAAEEYVNLLFDDSLKTDESIKVEIKEDFLTVTDKDEGDSYKIYLENSKVKIDSVYDFTVITIKIDASPYGNALVFLSNEISFGLVFKNKTIDSAGFGPGLN